MVNPEYKATLYNVWDKHFDDLEAAELDSPLLEMPSAVAWVDAKRIVRELFRELQGA